MGLFDFFRRKPKPKPKPDAGPDLPEPRCHHYTFTHIGLRLNCLSDPRSFLPLFGSSAGRVYLASVLRGVTNHCRGREERPDYSVDDITIHRSRIGVYPCVVFEMPPARAVAEAHMTAMVVVADYSNGPPEGESPASRYFTLEKGLALDGSPRTVLGEWTKDGVHMNYGDGPPAEVPAFVAAVAAKLAGS